ncbi:MAG: glycosyltransferase family 4 protein [Pseudomonadota bacterium]
MADFDSVLDSIVVPDDAPARIRDRFGLKASEEFRLGFFGGPGDVVGTFEHWRTGEHDPRTPVIAYSEMFYSLAHKLNATGIIFSETDPLPEPVTHGFQFVHVPRARGGSGLQYRLDEHRFGQMSAQAIREANLHAVIVSGDCPSNLLTGIADSTQVFLTVHNAFWQRGKRPTSLRARLRQLRMSRAFRRVTGAICTSEECANQLAELGVPAGNCLTEIPQILDHYIADAGEKSSGVLRRLVYLGRLEPQKGVFDLLHAFDTVAEDFPDLTLDIAGEGSAGSDLESLARQSKHGGRIEMHGHLSASGVHNLLNTSDVLICPTRDDDNTFIEGLALVVVEAALHGVPSIVSSAVPAQDLFPGACVPFQAGNKTELTNAIRSLANNPDTLSKLQSATRKNANRFSDRSLSWGSALYKVLTR